MAAKATKLGPGLLTIGDTATALDISCLLSAAWVKFDKDKEDDTPVLCGDDIPGSVEYPSTLSGTLAQDLDDDAGIVAYSWANKGTQQPFVFVPSTSAGKQVTGTLTIDPIDIGGDEVKKNMMSDFEWDILGDPVLGDYTPSPLAHATRREDVMI